MISLYLKDSVLTNQSRIFIEELKPKIKKCKNFFTKNVCVLHMVCRNSVFELVSKEKVFAI